MIGAESTDRVRLVLGAYNLMRYKIICSILLVSSIAITSFLFPWHMAEAEALFHIREMKRPNVPGLVVAADDELPDLTARSAIVMDAATGLVLYERDKDARRYPASTTKIMTLIIALENSDLDDMVTVSKHAAGTEGSTLWLEAGDEIRMGDLLYGMMLHSGNDATVAVAEHIAGSVPAFARLMTEKAHEIGAVHTNFINANGLPDDAHYTTAYDMARIAAYGYQLDGFEQIVSTKEASFAWVKDQTHRLRNENQMLWLYRGGNGVKTGYTDAAGRCLVSAARENGIQLVAVVFDSVYMWNDSIKLLDYGFSLVRPAQIVRGGEQVGEMMISGGHGRIPVCAAHDLTIAQRKDKEEQYEKKLVLDEVSAPVVRGDKVGKLMILRNGQEIASVDCVADADVVKKSFFARIVAYIKSFVGRWS